MSLHLLRRPLLNAEARGGAAILEGGDDLGEHIGRARGADANAEGGCTLRPYLAKLLFESTVNVEQLAPRIGKGLSRLRQPDGQRAPVKKLEPQLGLQLLYIFAQRRL